MRVTQATFLKSALRPEHFPRDGRPELAFVGRSNVGKSTMLNVLLNRKGLAKTSKTPGKTQTVNFFDVNGKVYFVDLPGYGYARVSKTLQEQWASILTGYLIGRDPLRLVIHLVDARHKPGPNDQDLLDVIERAEKPTIVVATKVDKLTAVERAKVGDELREHLGLCDDAHVIPFSSITKAGLHELWNVIDEQLR